ncbi:MAG: hypothetical protein RH917_04815 [Lacipirellulaceae bacterium]
MSRSLHSTGLVCIACCCLIVANITGCSETVETTTVTGMVSYKERPVSGGAISFLPRTGGRPLNGILSDGGKYEIQLPAGDYSVVIQPDSNLPEGFKEGDPMPPPDPNAVPARYQHPKRSGLKATVGNQTEPMEANFDLK